MFGAIFPGQGSQQPGMGNFLYDEFKVAKETFEEASDALGQNMAKLCFEGSETELSLTENTQPCLLLVSTASFRVLNSEFGFQPRLGAGHSIGEYAAMVTSGAMKFSDGIVAVRKRGQFMQSAVPVGEGGMIAAMGLTNEQAEKVCAWAVETSGFSPLECANFNAPGQIVLSGSKQATDWLPENFDVSIFPEPPRRVKFIPLKVSAPFHCSLMKPAEENMRRVLEDIEFQTPSYPIVQNVTGEKVEDPKTLRENLIKQISGSVRWTECMARLAGDGITHFVEVGNGKVLAGLTKKMGIENSTSFNLNSLDDLKNIEGAWNA